MHSIIEQDIPVLTAVRALGGPLLHVVLLELRVAAPAAHVSTAHEHLKEPLRESAQTAGAVERGEGRDLAPCLPGGSSGIQGGIHLLGNTVCRVVHGPSGWGCGDLSPLCSLLLCLCLCSSNVKATQVAVHTRILGNEPPSVRVRLVETMLAETQTLVGQKLHRHRDLPCAHTEGLYLFREEAKSHRGRQRDEVGDDSRISHRFAPFGHANFNAERERLILLDPQDLAHFHTCRKLPSLWPAFLQAEEDALVVAVCLRSCCKQCLVVLCLHGLLAEGRATLLIPF